MSKDETHSRAFLGLFLFFYAVWISWMNHVGRRMIYRRVRRLQKAREAHHGTLTSRQVKQ